MSSLQKQLITRMIKPFIPKIEAWMKEMPLEKGEIKSTIMLDIADEEIAISIVALKLEEDSKKLIVSRVIETFTPEKLL